MVQRSNTSIFQPAPPYYRLRGVSDTFLTQIISAVDNIDGDQLVIDWAPTNYIPSTLPPEADAITQLTAHLSGIDNAFGGAIVGSVPTIVANIAARDALTPSTGEQAYVLDASADATVPSGAAMYLWDGASWQKTSTADTSSDNLPLVASAGSTAATSVDGALLDLFGNDADFRSVLGVADGAANLGAFTGVTIPDNSNLLVALQALETAVEGVVAGGASGFVVTNITARDALTPSTGDSAYVLDASGDATVGSGSAQYVWTGALWSKVSDLETEAETEAQRTMSGTAVGATDLGTFPGSTIPDNSTLVAALQALETAVESASPGSAAAIVANIAARDALTPSTGDFSYVVDASGDATVPSGAATYVYDGGSWQKVADADSGSETDALRSSMGTASGDTDLGTFTGSTISDGATVISAFQEVETALEGVSDTFLVSNIAARDVLSASAGDISYVSDASADPTVASGAATYIFDGAVWQKISDALASSEAGDLRALTGTAAGATTLSPFSGDTISDGSTLSGALQELETALEAVPVIRVVTTIAARDALTPQAGDAAYVVDASADATVDSGAATYIYDGAAWQKVSDAESGAETDSLRASLGTAAGASDLGTFTGATISDGASVVGALQELETALEGLVVTGSTSSVVATIAARNALSAASGDVAYVSDASADATVGSGAASYIYDGASWLKITEAELEGEVGNLRTLTGSAFGAVDLGVFTGNTIGDNVTLLTALQQLETGTEAAAMVAAAASASSVVANVAARNALTPDTGDLAYVVDASADPSIGSGAATYIYDGASWQKVADAETESETSDLRSSLGTSVGDSDLPAFAGSTISTGATVVGALQELETAVEAQADNTLVANIAARDALSASTGDLAYVADASADPTVTSGAATYFYDGAVWQKVADAESGSEADALRALTGTGAGASDLGTFTGSTITDGSTIAGALQELETAFESSAGVNSTVVASIAARDALAPSAGDFAYVTDASADATVDSGAATYVYDGATWQKVAEAESATEALALRSSLGTSAGDTDMGTFTGGTLTDGASARTLFQELETAVDAAETAAGTSISDAGSLFAGTDVEAALQEAGSDLADLRTMTGTSDGDTDMGTFTGGTISDNGTLRGALQDLEIALEAIVPGATGSAVVNIAARNALAPAAGDVAYVADASADGTVASGSATYIYDGGAWQKIADAETEVETDTMRATLGTAAGASNLGAGFTGSTIPDNASLLVALQALETAIETTGGTAGSAVANIAARDALTPASGDISYVADASADPTVSSGAATYMYDGAAWQKVAEAESSAEADALRASMGTSAGDSDLGTFAGGVISDNTDVVGALGELEAAAEAAATAAGTSITDAGTLITATDVEGALQEGAGEWTSLRTLSGTAAGASALGAFAGTTIADGSTISGALQALETATEAAAAAATTAATGAGTSIADAGSLFTATDVEGALQEAGSDLADLRTMTGTVDGATDMGAFAGGTITDGSDLRTVLQDLETAVEANAAAATAAATGAGTSIVDAGTLITATNVEGALQEGAGEWTSLRATVGTAAGASNMGTFSGSTVTDGATLRTVIQDLETAVEAAGGATGSVVFNIAARDALTASTGDMAYVVDASADATVGSGAATYMYDGTSWLKVAEAETITETAALRSSLGTPAGDADLGTFTGGTLSDNTDLRTLLQELETAVEAVGGAGGISIADAGAFFAGSDVEAALQEAGSDLADLRTMTGTSDGDTDMGTFTGAIISDNGTLRDGLQELETATESAATAAASAATGAGTSITDAGALFAATNVEGALQEAGSDLADLRTMTGTSDGDTDMGTFAGSTITDGTDLRTALQDLETAVEGNATAAAGAATAAGTSIADAGSLIAGTTVEAALQEGAGEWSTLRTSLGTAGGASDMGTFTGGTLTDNTSVRVNLQELETAVDAAETAAGTSIVDAGTLITATDVEGALQEGAGEWTSLRSSLGTAAGASNMGAFTGSTITDGTDIRTALQELETAVEANDAAATAAATAAGTSIVDAGTLITATDVEGALQEGAGEWTALRSLSGTAAGAAALGAFAGTTIADGSTISGALQALETATESAGTAAAAAATGAGTSIVDAGTLYTSTNVEGALQEAGSDIADLRTMTGTVDGATDMGTFAGGIISDNVTLRAGLQELETATEGAATAAAAAATGAGTSIVDAGTLITATNVEGALQEGAGEWTSLRTSLGTATGASNMGTFTGTTIADNSTVSAALQALETAVEAATGTTAAGVSIADAGTLITGTNVETALQEGAGEWTTLRTLSGTALGASDLGTFTGGVISDSATVRGALQELETALEAIPGSLIVANIAARDALTASAGTRVYVTDASADGTVGSGAAFYIWDGAAWQKISEAESLDLIAASVSITDAGGYYAGTSIEAALQEVGEDAADLRTLTGTADGASALGTFTGSTIADGSTITAALQALETLSESASTSAAAAATAAGTSIADAGSLITGTNVETALQEGAGEWTTLRTMTGTAAGASDLGTFTGGTLTDNTTLRVNLQELETAVDLAETAAGTSVVDVGGLYTGTTVEAALAEVGQDAADLRTLSGTADGATNLGVFAGTTITDSVTVRAALQELETAVESAGTAAAAAATAAGTSVSDVAGLYAGATVEAALAEVGQDAADLRILSGTADGATNLGTFTGGTITDGTDLRTALQDLETAVESNATAATAAATAVGTSITDTGTLITATNVEGALQEGAGEWTTLRTMTGTGAGASDMGTFTGTTITDNVTLRAALQELETAVEAAGGTPPAASVTIADAGSLIAGTNVEDALQEGAGEWTSLRTSLGTAAGASDMGAFTGGTLTDNTTVRANLQELETAVDLAETGAGTSIVDAGTLFTATNVEGALQEAGSDIADIRTMTGTADGATDMGTFTGTTISDNVTLRAALQELETAVEAAGGTPPAASVTVADGGGFFAGANVEAALQEAGQDIADFRTALGIADGASNLGTFTGGTISDNVSLLVALQELETAVEAGTDDQTASEVNITDAGSLYTGTTVEAALAEVGQDAADIRSLTGTADGASVLGAFSGSTITTGVTITAALQELETAVEAASDDQTALEVNITDAGGFYAGTTVEAGLAEAGQDIADFRTALGIADGASNLGTFTGGTISDNVSLLTALQELETAVEAGTDDQTASEVNITDAGGFYAGTTVEAALAEVGSDAADLRSLTGTADGAAVLGAFTGGTIPDGVTITAALQALETAVEAGSDDQVATEVNITDAGGFYTGTTVEAGLAEAGQDIADFRTALGIADGASDLGTFTGSVITDNVNLLTALQELETAVEAGTDDQTAAEVSIADAGTIITATDVEGALQEGAGEWTTLRTMTGTATGATDMGTFTGTTITDNVTLRAALQELEAAVEAAGGTPPAASVTVADGGGFFAGANVEAALQEAGSDIADIRTMTGTADGATDMGTFTGSIITDNVTLRAALQELETAVEAGSDDQTAAEVNITDTGGFYTGTTVEAALAEVGQDAADIRSLTGTADGATVLGAFSGSTITTGVTITAALQELETAVEAGSDDQTAAEVTIADAGTLITATDVEGALQEGAGEWTTLRTMSGTAAGASNMGTFTGTTITDNVTLRVALQELETAVEAAGGTPPAASVTIADAGGFFTGTNVEAGLQEAGQDIADFRTALGIADGASNLGTFTGAIITDNTNLLTALQELETAVEAGSDDQTAAEVNITDAGGFYTGTTVEAGLAEAGQDIADFRTALGIADGASNLGTFTGAIITDNTNLLTALQELETAVEAGSDDQTATEVNITDTGGFYTGTTVEAALAEVGQDAADIRSLTGTADGATVLGAFSGSTIATGVTITAALQALETAVEAGSDDQTAAEVTIADAGTLITATDVEGALQEGAGEWTTLRTLTGTAAGASNLGTFTGTTITDNVSLLVALQELETAVEGISVPAAASVAPLISAGNTGTVGTDTVYARQDHVHPAFFTSVDTKATGVYTTVDTDFGQYIRVDANVTVHAGSTAPIGAEIQVRNTLALGNLIQMLPAVGVTLNGLDRIDGQESIVIKKIAANEYDLTGGQA